MATSESGFLENLREVHGRTIFSLKLPDEYRDQLKNPIGQVYPTDTDNELVKLEKVTAFLLQTEAYDFHSW